MLKQALVLGGGRGTRMSQSLNPRGCKSLIEYGGKPMIGYVLEALIEGGIQEIVIAASEHSYQPIRDLLKDINVKADVVPTPYIDENGTIVGAFRKVPYWLQDLLDNRFFYACGHQPMPAEFVSRMVAASQTADCVIASYDGTKFPADKPRRILFEGDPTTPRLRPVETKEAEAIPNHRYVRNPYIIKKGLLELCKADGFSKTFSFYVYKDWQVGGSLAVVDAPMPPEYDYDREFELTKRFLDEEIARRKK